MGNTGKVVEASLKLKLQEAADLLRSGGEKPALKLLHGLNQSHPDQPDVLRLLGVVYLRAGQPDRAEHFMREVVRIKPDHPLAASDLAHVLMALERADEALDVMLPHVPAAESLAAGPDAATFHFNLGRAFKALGRSDEAVGPLQRTLGIQPGHPAALVMLGDVEKALGHPAKAAGHYRQAMEHNPGNGSAWWSLSNLKSGGFSDDEFEKLKQHAAVSRKGEQKIFFDFALAKAYEQRGDTDRAFAYYQSGNREKRSLEPWDRQGFSQWMKSLRSAMGEVKLAPRQDVLPSPRPVFLVSLPRSGSTLTEQVLAAHSQVTAAGELPWIPRILADESSARRRNKQESGLSRWAPALSEREWQTLGEQYLRHCQPWCRDTPVFTDKLPGNIPYVGVILAMLPNALIVNIRRNAMDVCWSCYRQLFVSGAEFAYDLDDLAAYWQEQQRQINFWHKRAPDRIFNLDYEALVRQPEPEVRRLLDFLDLPFEAACLNSHEAERAINTPSASQVRQAINTRGIDHWRKYEKHLGGLARALGKNTDTTADS